VIRPVVEGEILAADGTAIVTMFLIDTGADRTIISKDILDQLGHRLLSPSYHVEGLGGRVASVEVAIDIRLPRETGELISIHGHWSAVTDVGALDMSVLGPDISGLFALIVDRPNNVVCLVGQNHSYNITPV